MGYLGVRTIVAHIRGQAVEKVIDTGVALATLDNMDRPEIQALLSPDLSLTDD
jgi:ribose transport system substrate-binding protein